jgi:hypothetical protein
MNILKLSHYEIERINLEMTKQMIMTRKEQ